VGELPVFNSRVEGVAWVIYGAVCAAMFATFAFVMLRQGSGAANIAGLAGLAAASACAAGLGVALFLRVWWAQTVIVGLSVLVVFMACNAVDAVGMSGDRVLIAIDLVGFVLAAYSLITALVVYRRNRAG
jgi:hypothetical protein